MGYESLAPVISNCIIWGDSLEEIAGGSPVITYSDIQGGWAGDGNFDENPHFIGQYGGDYHLRFSSNCIDAGDPSNRDGSCPPGLGGKRSDLGIYGGELNVGWPPDVDVNLSISPNGPVTIPKGDILEFTTYIQNNTDIIKSGEYWLSVLQPNSSEILIPDNLLNYPNPLTGQVFPNNFIELDNELFIPSEVSVGRYILIGRLGVYPDMVIDQEVLVFHVVE
jgi:hypothetical protein